MKNIIKSAFLFCTCLVLANISFAQMASDSPSPATPVHVKTAEVKLVVVQTASSTLAGQAPTTAKSVSKSPVKTPAVDPVASQGKEVPRLASDTVIVLPAVSLQTAPAKKSE